MQYYQYLLFLISLFSSIAHASGYYNKSHGWNKHRRYQNETSPNASYYPKNDNQKKKVINDTQGVTEVNQNSSELNTHLRQTNQQVYAEPNQPLDNHHDNGSNHHKKFDYTCWECEEKKGSIMTKKIKKRVPLFVDPKKRSGLYLDIVKVFTLLSSLQTKKSEDSKGATKDLDDSKDSEDSKGSTKDSDDSKKSEDSNEPNLINILTNNNEKENHIYGIKLIQQLFHLTTCHQVNDKYYGGVQCGKVTFYIEAEKYIQKCDECNRDILQDNLRYVTLLEASELEQTNASLYGNLKELNCFNVCDPRVLEKFDSSKPIHFYNLCCYEREFYTKKVVKETIKNENTEEEFYAIYFTDSLDWSKPVNTPPRIQLKQNVFIGKFIDDKTGKFEFLMKIQGLSWSERNQYKLIVLRKRDECYEFDRFVNAASQFGKITMIYHFAMWIIEGDSYFDKIRQIASIENVNSKSLQENKAKSKITKEDFCNSFIKPNNHIQNNPVTINQCNNLEQAKYKLVRCLNSQQLTTNHKIYQNNYMRNDHCNTMNNSMIVHTTSQYQDMFNNFPTMPHSYSYYHDGYQFNPWLPTIQYTNFMLSQSNQMGLPMHNNRIANTRPQDVNRFNNFSTMPNPYSYYHDGYQFNPWLATMQYTNFMLSQNNQMGLPMNNNTVANTRPQDVNRFNNFSTMPNPYSYYHDGYQFNSWLTTMQYTNFILSQNNQMGLPMNNNTVANTRPQDVNRFNNFSTIIPSEYAITAPNSPSVSSLRPLFPNYQVNYVNNNSDNDRQNNDQDKGNLALSLTLQSPRIVGIEPSVSYSNDNQEVGDHNTLVLPDIFTGIPLTPLAKESNDKLQNLPTPTSESYIINN